MTRYWAVVNREKEILMKTLSPASERDALWLFTQECKREGQPLNWDYWEREGFTVRPVKLEIESEGER
jgi:hypothetical protein